jgi:CMP/dCMP kinase
MVIAIDGPAGSGKSTIARLLSQRLGFVFIETGAMYRAVALAALRRGIPLTDAAALEAVARELAFEFIPAGNGNRVLVNGEDVTQALRAPELGDAASVVSTVPGVRRALVERQRELGAGGRVVMEGRDIGTKVFPNADLKVYLDATPRVRSIRRVLQEEGLTDASALDPARIARTEADIRQRDQRDTERADSPLTRAPDAVYLDSSEMTVDQVLDAIAALVRERSARQA